MHILPRKTSDFQPQDAIYEVLDCEGAAQATPAQVKQQQKSESRQMFKMDADRQPRSEEEMEAEARWLADFFK